MSTLRTPPGTTCPRSDAQNLHRAFGSGPPDPDSSFYRYRQILGCDKARVVNILAHRDATQRALIQKAYLAMYSEDILKRLPLELSGNLKTSVLLWMTDPVERDLQFVKQGLSSETKNLQAATEVICSRTPSQIQSFKEQYQSRFSARLEDDIGRQPFGHHRELLLAYISTPRAEGLEYDREIAMEDSRALSGTDERTFIRIFSERSKAQLAAVISAYHALYGNSLEKAVKGKKWGLFGYALWTILICSESLVTYFAEVLHNAIKCLRVHRAHNTTLIRVIVTRTEIDMQDIKAEYLRKYKKTLNDAVNLQTSGHYRTFLLSLLGPNHQPNGRWYVFVGDYDDAALLCCFCLDRIIN